MSIYQALLLKSGKPSLNLSEPFMMESFVDHIDEITSLKALASLDSLFDTWPANVTAYHKTKGDESNSSDVECLEAKDLYQKGMSLLFNDIDRHEAILSKSCKQLQSELDLPAMTYGRSLVYATPGGHGTSLHFDQNINFVIQLSGQKSWSLAANTSVKNPLTRYAVGEVMDDELASYCHEEPPSALPQEATELTLKEGSLLFIPQGMWHETQASSDSLSLNFTYSVPSWVDLTLAALRSKLVMKEGWRQSLRYDCSDIEMANHFDDLLKEARNELSSWDSHELLQYFK